MTATHDAGRFPQPLPHLEAVIARLGMVCLLAALLAIPAHSQANSAPTNIAVTAKVLHDGVKRLGINLSGQSYYDSGILLRDLTFRNPGFEGEMWQTVLQCKFVKGDSCADGDEWSSWPADFARGGSFEFFYGAAKGQTGVVAGSTVANTAPHQGVWVSFGKLAVPPQVGDFYIVRMNFPGGADLGWRVGVKGGATVTTETQDIAKASPGRQALRLTAVASYQSASVTSDVDTWADRSFVQLKGAYTLSFRAKAAEGRPSLTVSVTRITTKHGRLNYLIRQIPLSSSWQDFQFPLRLQEDGTFIGPIQVSYEVHAGAALFDDSAFTEAADADNPTAFRNAVVDRLRELRPGILRYMDNGTGFGSTLDNLLAPPFARKRAGFGEGPHEQQDIPIGLNEFLVLCHAIQAEPWFVLPSAATPAEMRNLLEFLAAPAERPYGAKRAALGQAVPWTQVFPTIHLELGNETWNWGSFPGEGIPDPKAYGTRVAQIFAAAKGSPHYKAGKIDLVMNGWCAVPWWTEEALKMGTHADSVDMAPYTFNPFDDASSPEAIFGPMFAEAQAWDSRPAGLVAANARLAAQYGVKLAAYEVNLGTSMGKVSQADLESAIPSLGAGLAVAENMLLMLRDQGVVNQAFFALPEYANGFRNPDHPEARELVKLWGSVVDMGGETNRVRPSFLAEQLANEAIAGTMIETVPSGANPTWDQPKSANSGVQLTGAHFLESFAFVDGGHVNLVILNLSRSDTLPVTLSGPGAPRGTVHRGQLSSPHITDSNEFAQNVAIARDVLSNFNPATPLALAPYSMTVLTWEAGDLHLLPGAPQAMHPAAHRAAVGSKP